LNYLDPTLIYLIMIYILHSIFVEFVALLYKVVELFRFQVDIISYQNLFIFYDEIKVYLFIISLDG